MKNMKKIISTILVIMLMVSVVSSMAFAAASLEVSTVNMKDDGTTLTASALFTNPGSSDITAKLIMAQYLGKVLESVVCDDITVKAGAEYLAKATDDKVSGADVKCFLLEGESISPLSTVAVKGETPALGDIKVNGVSIPDFNAATTSYTISTTDMVVPVVEGVPANSSCFTTTSYGDITTTETTSTVVATVVVKSNSSAASTTYTVTINYTRTVPPLNYHIVDESSIEYKATLTDGVVRTNFHADSAGYDDTNLKSANGDGSPLASNKTAEQAYIGAINLESIVGCDYFLFNDPSSGSGKLSSFDATYSGNALKFKLTAPATVSIFLNNVFANNSDDLESAYDGWTFSRSNDSSTGQAELVTGYVKNWYIHGNDNGNSGFQRRYSREYGAGDVVEIPYTEKFATANHNVIVVITPKASEATKLSPMRSDVTFPANGMNLDGNTNMVGTKDLIGYYNSVHGTNVVNNFTDVSGFYPVDPTKSLVPGSLTDGENANNSSTDMYFANVTSDFGHEVMRLNDRVIKSDSIVAAFKGIAPFDKPIVFYNFTLNRPCQVVVYTTSIIDGSVYEENGYKKVDLGNPAFEIKLVGFESGEYNTAYIKDFNTGDTVEYYTGIGSEINQNNVCKSIPMMVLRYKY